jgi:hypothetical protein
LVLILETLKPGFPNPPILPKIASVVVLVKIKGKTSVEPFTLFQYASFSKR